MILTFAKTTADCCLFVDTFSVLTQKTPKKGTISKNNFPAFFSGSLMNEGNHQSVRDFWITLVLIWAIFSCDHSRCIKLRLGVSSGALSIYPKFSVQPVEMQTERTVLMDIFRNKRLTTFGGTPFFPFQPV